MSRWLAAREPLATVRISVRLPRVKSKDERLRERATAYVDRMLANRDVDTTTYRGRDLKRVRIAVALNERKAVLNKLNGVSPTWLGSPPRRIPRWQWLLRREVERQLLEKHRIDKWW